MQNFTLSHAEITALRKAATGHDLDDFGVCACRHHAHNADERVEHLMEVAFRSGETHAQPT